MPLNHAGPIETYGQYNTKHPLARSPQAQSYSFTLADEGTVVVCEAIPVGLFLITVDIGSTVEAAIFAVDATHTTEMASTTTANWSGGTTTTADDYCFFYDSTSGGYILDNDGPAGAELTFHVTRIV